MRYYAIVFVCSLMTLTAYLSGCGGGGGHGIANGNGANLSELVSDFLLEDVNDTSPSFATDVSPRDYLNFTTAWFFGFAT